MQFLLRGLLAWDLTERESGLGVVYLSFGLGLLVFTPIGGVLADRWAKRTLLVLGQGTIALVAAAMGLAAVSNNAQFWMLMVASLAQGAMFGLIGPARVTTAAELVGHEHLGNAISLTSMSMSLTRIFGPAAAGGVGRSSCVWHRWSVFGSSCVFGGVDFADYAITEARASSSYSRASSY